MVDIVEDIREGVDTEQIAWYETLDAENDFTRFLKTKLVLLGILTHQTISNKFK